MKNWLLPFVLCAGLLAPAVGRAQAFAQGDKILQAGISFGTYNYGGLGLGWGGRSIGVPPLNASFEYGFHEYLSAGPYLAYSTYSYNFSNQYKYSYTNVAFGVRGSFHYLPLLNELADLDLDEERFDLYVTLMVGGRTYNWSGDGFNGDGISNGFSPQFNSVLGARYKFSPAVGVYAELGRGALGYATLGVSLHF